MENNKKVYIEKLKNNYYICKKLKYGYYRKYNRRKRIIYYR